MLLEMADDLWSGCQLDEHDDVADIRWLSKYVYCRYAKTAEEAEAIILES